MKTNLKLLAVYTVENLGDEDSNLFEVTASFGGQSATGVSRVEGEARAKARESLRRLLEAQAGKISPSTSTPRL